MAFWNIRKRGIKKLEESNKNEAKGSYTFSTLGFYLRLLTDFQSKGLNDRNTPKEGEIVEGNFYYSSNRIFTRYGVKKMYFLYQLPVIMDRGFIDDIRELVESEVDDYNAQNNTDYKVALDFVQIGERYDLDFSKRKVQGTWKNLARRYQKLENARQNRSMEEELESNKYSDAVRRQVMSYRYMKEAKEERKSAFYKTTVTLELVCYGNPATVDEVLQVAERRINDYCYQENVIQKPVFLQSNEYQKTYSPISSPDRKSILKKMYLGDVWTDNTLSSFTIAKHGIVGDKHGVYHGIDILSRKILTFDLYSGEDANNILLTAGTGMGKSGYAKTLAIFLAVDPLFDVVIFDYEGAEYDAIVNTFEFLSIGFSSDDGSYINTMVIEDEVGNEETDSKRMIDAREATEKAFNILFTDPSDKTGMKSGMNQQEMAIFSKLLSNTWGKFGVTEDPKTWGRSKGITYYHMYDMLDSMVNDSTYGNQDLELMGGREALLDFQRVLMPYFAKSGNRSHWFKKPISVQDVLDAPNIRFSFGMQGKDENTEPEQLIALTQLFASQLTLLKAKKNKASVPFRATVTFIEEMQRYIKIKHSKDIIGKLVSGGRKSGLVNYLITNSPQELFLESTYGGREDNSVSQIMSAINMQIIGGLDANVMGSVIDYYNLHDASGYLAELVDVFKSSHSSTENKNEHPLKYTFFVNRGGQSTLCKMLVHPQLANTKLYETVGGETLKEARSKENMEKAKLRKEIKRGYDKDLEDMDKDGYKGLNYSDSVPDKFISKDLVNKHDKDDFGGDY